MAAYAKQRQRFVLKRAGLGVVIMFLAFLLGRGWGAAAPEAEAALAEVGGEPWVRVRISTGSALELAVEGAVSVCVGDPYAEGGAVAGERLARLAELPFGRVREQGGSWQLGGQRLEAAWLELLPERDGTIVVQRGDKRLRYRGSLLLGRHRGELIAVSRLSMERYLMGVVGCEMSASWHAEALSAQAIAARSYALAEVNRRRASSSQVPYDVRDSQASQVYRGLSAEDSRVTDAVSTTRGAVLLWQGRPLKAFFHSTCGGRTVDVQTGLGVRTITPLAGRPCGYCNHSPVHTWTRRYQLSGVRERLVKLSGAKLGTLRRVRLTRSGGLVDKVVFDDGRQQVTLSSTRLRRMLGTGTKGMLSRDFALSIEGGQLVAVGRGFGHTVGLCQYGAQGMARAAHAGEQIVNHYYPGATLARLW